MKSIFTLLIAFITISLLAQSPGDTIVIPTFNYTQTHGWPWCGFSRDTMIDFPDDPGATYEKIIMAYNMRCKDGLVSTHSNPNLGCGEWDYSCNTYIHDSLRVDSVISFTNSHTISGFSGSTYEFANGPLYNYYQYNQKEVVINNTISESVHTIGSGNIALTEVLGTDQHSSKSQYLFTQAELSAAGIVGGEINGLELEVLNGTASADYLRVKIKHTSKTELNSAEPDMSDFTEVYFHDLQLANGANRIQFYEPFEWNGTSNIIIEFSLTNHITGDQVNMKGSNTADVIGLVASNQFNLKNVNGKIPIPAEPFSDISEEITVSFWSYGNEEVLPNNNSIIYGDDNSNNRQLNVHLPWGNSNIYFDCGNDGSGYDRIDKTASPEEFEGNWSHWAFTKNATTGNMHIYHNGELWHSGTGKTKLIDIQEMIFGTSGSADRTYFGKVDKLCIWNKELPQSTIHEWMNKPISASHPDFMHLLAYYKLDEGSGTAISDASDQGQTTAIEGYMYWMYERGNKISRGFEETTHRPNITFAQGEYNLTVTDVIVTDSVMIDPNIVRAYEIIPNYGTIQDDSIAEISADEYWQAQYEYTYDPVGDAIDSAMAATAGSIEITELSYYKRYPSKFEIMSFVTPYGKFLDLGMDGKTWYFDVTDYAPVLKGSKRMTIERGGEWQEDMDIQFYFIQGTPPRDILDLKQIWRADSKSYTDIQNERAFETRSIEMLPEGESFKLLTVITGHGQEGEFTPRHHTMNIDGGDIEIDQTVWTECSTIPIYPQGGTWIYDRAGWCPGDPSDIHQYDITEYVTPGQSHTFDYNVTYASGTSNYIVRQHLITYGPPNFNLDAAIVKVLKPNKNDASQERFNPACSYPEIVIQNRGATTLTSLQIEYYVEGGEAEVFNWTGTLEFLEQETVRLPIPELTFWLGTEDKFTVHINNPNNQDDEYSYNNTSISYFDDIHVYPENEIITVQLKTNNYGFQTSYTIYDGDGNIFYERTDCDNNTIYNDEFFLFPGCYTLRIDDSGDNGLEFWHQPAQGSGYCRLKDADNNVIYAFDPDFGSFAIHEFAIGNITKINELTNPFNVSVYPNPATDKVMIEITGNENNEIKISLYNSLMSKITSKEYMATANELETYFNLENLPAGVYFIRIDFGSYSKTEKIIKR